MAGDLTTEELPTLLVVGTGEPMWEAIEAGLERHATFAEGAEKDSAAQAAMVAAPDVILLVGDAAKDHDAVLASFAQHPIARVVPVIILIDRSNLQARLDASRRGVTFVERSASADQVAREIAALCRELPDRPSKPSMELGETSLDEVLAILKTELQSGILSVKTGQDEGARFVLRSGRKVGSAIQDFVSRIRPLVEKADGPVRFDFESAESREIPLFDDLDDDDDGDLAIFRDRRIVLIEDDSAAADTLAQELRAHGATVVVVTSSGSGLPRARSSDPEIVLVEEHGLDGPTYEVMQTLRRDPRLKWASLLVIRRDELLPPDQPPRMERLARAFEPLLAADEEVARQAAELDAFDTRLEALGPSRLLRALASADRTLRATIRHPRTVIEVSFAEGLVAGAEARKPGQTQGEVVGGPKALAALLAISTGRVRVEARAAPATANLLSPPGSALAAAAEETPPIKPSLPPPPMMPARPSQPPQQLLAQLEQVLGELEAAGMISQAPPPPAADVDEGAPTSAMQRLKPASTEKQSFQIPKPGPVPRDAAKPAAPPKPVIPKPAPRAKKPARAVPAPSALAKGLVPERAKAPKPVAPKSGPPPAPPPPAAAVPRRQTRKKTLVGMVAPVAAPEPPSPPPVEEVADEPSEAAPPPAPEPSAPRPAPSVPPPTPAAMPVEPPAPVPVPAPVAAPVEPPAPLIAPVLAAPEIAPAPEVAPVPVPLAGAAPVALAAPPEPEGMSTDATLAFEAPSKRPWWHWAVAAIVLFTVSAVAAFYLGGDDPQTVAMNAEPTATDTDPDPTPTATETETEEAEQVEAETEEAETEAVATEETETEEAETEEAEAEEAEAETEEAEADEEEEEEELTAEEREALGEGESSGQPQTRAERLSALINAGNFFRSRRRYTLAERRYESALRLSASNARALTGISLVKIAQREPNQAVRYARRLVRVRPGSAGARVILGDALALDGDRTGARREYRKALEINPRHSGARRRLRR
ncbi:MAG: hypothetical protein JJ863_01525 [Deltaproteobacteria bacterium]|nr:hypothetical protein [Deltaproteobacteria bacterium]